MIEMWKPIIGYEGLYEVSSDGRIRSLERTISRSDGIKQPVCGRILKDTASSTGYRTVALSDRGRKRTRLVHRLVLTAFRGKCPEGQEAAHLNGIRSDNRLDNLTWATLKENAAHRFLHGTQVFGARAGSSKLKTKQVLEIRRSNLTHREIAAKYNVDRSTISRILSGEQWSHVSGETDGK